MTPLPRPEYRELKRYDPGRRPVALDLSDNTNLWGTHPAALERIRAAGADDLARYPEPYADTLRAAVSERFDVPSECVTTGAGSDDVLDSAFRAAAAPGALVAYAAPTFSMIGPLAAMNGLASRSVQWPDAFDDPTLLLSGDPAIVYVCRPNNPTGELVPREWVERLVGERRRVRDGLPLLVIDEAYADFAGDSLIRWAPGLENVLVTRTASKAYGLAGLRCGFGVAREHVAIEIDKSRGPYKVSRLAIDSVAEAIRDRSGWMAETVSECSTNRERLWAELDGRRLRPIRSYANFVLFAAPSGSAADDARALRELGVAVRPFVDVSSLGDALRVTVGPWPMMETFLDALDRLVDDAGDRDAGGTGA